MKKTVNQMIFATLKTKGDKPAKYADELSELGYEVTNVVRYDDREYTSDYWNVNGLELFKPDRGAIYVSLRGGLVERLDNIGRIDFEGYFAKFDERKAKADAMAERNGIWQKHRYIVNKRFVYVDDEGTEWRWPRRGCEKVMRRAREHRIHEGNTVIDEYKNLKRRAEARGGYWSGDKENYEIEFAKRMLRDAERDAERLRRELERAEERIEERKAAVAREVEKKAEGQDELNAWLVERGIRKGAA